MEFFCKKYSKGLKALEFSLQTGWLLILLALMTWFWQPSPYFLYLIPVNAIITFVKYVGIWQEFQFKVLYATIIGGLLGVILVRISSMKPLIFILFFFFTYWINCRSWDRIIKLISLETMYVVTIMPLVSLEHRTLFQNYSYVFGLIYFPALLWGFVLLFPKPSFAFLAVKPLLHQLSSKIVRVIQSLISAFLSYDYLDYHSLESNQVLEELQTSILPSIKQLLPFICNEQYLFHEIKEFLPVLVKVIDTSDLLLSELQGLHGILKNLIYNKTLMAYIKKLSGYLTELNQEVELLFYALGEYFDTFTLLPTLTKPSWFPSRLWGWLLSPFTFHENHFLERIQIFQTKLHRRSRSFKQMNQNDFQFPKFSDDPKQSTMNYQNHPLIFQHYSFLFEKPENIVYNNDAEEEEVDSLLQSSSASEKSIVTRDQYRSYLRKEFLITLEYLLQLRQEILIQLKSIREIYLASDPDEEDLENHHHSLSHHNDRLNPYEIYGDSDHEDDHHLKVKGKLTHLRRSLQDDNERFGLYNISPKFAFLHRITLMVEILSSFKLVFPQVSHSIPTQPSMTPVSPYFYRHIYEGIRTSFDFHVKSIIDYLTFEYRFYRDMLLFLCFGDFSAFIQHFWKGFSSTSQHLKLAVSLTIASLFPILDLIPMFLQRGSWIFFTCMFVRQDNLSNSCHTAYQRLEGTAIGAIFAYFLYLIIPCYHQSTAISGSTTMSTETNDPFCENRIFFVNICFLIPWIVICLYFRENSTHGYTAIVAGFTPIVLLSTIPGEKGSFSRIYETVLGLGIYLFIEILIYPIRQFPIMRQSMIRSLENMKDIISMQRQAIGIMVEFEEVDFRRILSKSPPLHHHHSQQDDKNREKERIEEERNEIDQIEMRKLSSFTNKMELTDHPDEEEDQEPFSKKSNISSLSSFSTTLLQPAADQKVSLELFLEHIQEIYQIFHDSIQLTEKQLHSLKQEIFVTFSSSLSLFIQEPNFMLQDLPSIPSLQFLSEKLRKMYASLLSITNGSKELMNVFYQMLQRQEESVSLILAHLSFLLKHVLIVLHKSHAAMSNALETLSFHSWFISHRSAISAVNSESHNFEALLTMKRQCDKLLHSVQTHFQEYTRLPSEILSPLNPYLLVAIWNIFEIIIDFVHDLSELGMSLQMIQNSERG